MIRVGLREHWPEGKLDPPAPVIEGVEIWDVRSGRKSPQLWSALIDTGAGISAIPQACVGVLGLSERTSVQVDFPDRSQPGGEYPLYFVQLRVPGLDPLETRVVALPRQTIILGRDFLQNTVLIVDSLRAICRAGVLPPPAWFWARLPALR